MNKISMSKTCLYNFSYKKSYWIVYYIYSLFWFVEKKFNSEYAWRTFVFRTVQ